MPGIAPVAQSDSPRGPSKDNVADVSQQCLPGRCPFNSDKNDLATACERNGSFWNLNTF
jgi:hypothetical protein